MSFSPLIDELVEALRVLPGVGPKSAQRMVMHLLERNRTGGARLADALAEAMENVGRCPQCRTFTEEPICGLCSSSHRDSQTVCVVETPADILAIEQSGGYRGTYFVLMGHLSPIDGIGPSEIGVDQLLEQINHASVNEVIIATGTTVEGEATSFYISEQLRPLGVMVSRIAHGVPLGGDLEYVDGGTLAHALSGRQEIK
ncbi:MAG: recombination mediator RecR [Pseudomonadales bacterium]